MKKVLIFNYGGKNVVWPPYVVVKQGEEVVFIAVNTDATVFFPKSGMLEADGTAAPPSLGPGKAKGKGITLAVGKKRGRIKVKKMAPLIRLSKDARTKKDYPLPGIYPYSVYCRDGNDFAEGNTSPIMIIEPPNDEP